MRRGKLSDLGPVEKGYFISLDIKKKHLQSSCILAHTLPFVAPSVILINTKNGLIVINKPGSHE